MKWLRMGALVLLLGGCDGAKAVYDAVAATGDHTKPPIPLAAQAAAAASAQPASAAPAGAPQAGTSVAPAPAATPPAAASATPAPTPTPTATPAPAVERYDGPFFSLRWNALHWAFAEATIEQHLLGDVGYLTLRGADNVKLAIVDDPSAKPFEYSRTEATARMTRVRFSRETTLGNLAGWEAFGLVASAATATEDEDAPAADLDAASGKATYYLVCNREGRNYGLRMELDATTPNTIADQQLQRALQVAATWSWKY